MNNKHWAMVCGVLLVGMVFLLTGHSKAFADPQGVYGLYDANDTYLGNILSADYLGGTISYTTYLPEDDRILSISSSNGGIDSPTKLPTIYYENDDCTGTPYMSTDSMYQTQWIGEDLDGNLLATATTSQTFTTTESYKDVSGCSAIEFTNYYYMLSTPSPSIGNISSIISPLRVK